MATATQETTAQEEALQEVVPAEPPAWILAVKDWWIGHGAWYFVSMMSHMTAIVAAGLLLGDVAEANRVGEVPQFDTALDVAPEETSQVELTSVLEKRIQPSNMTTVSTVSAGGMGGGGGLGSAVASAVGGVSGGGGFAGRGSGPRVMGGSGLGGMSVDVGVSNIFGTSGGGFAAAAPQGMAGDPLSTAQGYGDAMDRITQEVVNMLVKGKVLLVWVMDQSESMQDDRDEILARIERVYVELGLSAAAKDDALLTAVTSYGATTLNHTPRPTNNPAEIADALRAVPVDPTGAEMQCQAIGFAAANYGKFASSTHRQIAIVLVTDESGDMASNVSQVEQTIALCKSMNCKVYVLGRESVFGYPYAYMRYTDPETKTGHWLRIDRGPETPQAEQLQVNGFHRRHDAFPSGFGPYEQSRIARLTGGIFFMLPSPEVQLVGRRADLIYDADNMRAYLPDLSARQDYIAERDLHVFRKTIFQVISDLNPYQQGSRGSRVELKTDHFSIDPAVFAKQATTEMKKAADLIMYFQDAQKHLEEVASYRAREVSPRWRANYDLIYAQLISYQARVQEYGWYLAEFMKTPKPITNRLGPARPTNGWDIHAVKRLLKPDITAGLREKADDLFRKVVKDYPGTPWAARAEEELRRGYGSELIEDFEDPRGRGGIKLPKL